MYDVRFSATFMNKLTAQTESQRRTIEGKIKLVRSAPLTACKSERLRWDLSGKRSARVDQRWRLIYAICEECHQRGDQGRNLMDCPECEQVPSKTVNFLDILDYH